MDLVAVAERLSGHPRITVFREGAWTEGRWVMDEFVGFNFVLLDASLGSSQSVKIVEEGPGQERVDVIAHQFRDFLKQGDPADTSPRAMLLSDDFKLQREVGQTAGWLTFLVNHGGGTTEALEEVALVVFITTMDAAGRQARQKLEPYLIGVELPPTPLVVAVRLSAPLLSIISEWLGKCVAGFFATRS